MASFTLGAAPTFPNGTTVKAYPKSNWPTPDLPSGTPLGSKTAEGSVSGGSVTFTGLTAGTGYWAAAEVNDVYRYVGIIVPVKAGAKGFIEHGAVAGTARPEGFESIEWVGSVEPENALDADTWIET